MSAACWQRRQGRSRPARTRTSTYQAKLLGTAKVEVISLAQTSASLFADDYDAVTTQRISSGGGCPGDHLGAGDRPGGAGARRARIALVSPYSQPVIERAKHYYESKYGLQVVAMEGFAATDSYMIGKLGPENARDAFARIDRPEIEVLVVPGGNFPTMSFVPAWEREFGKPVITTNRGGAVGDDAHDGRGERLPGLGRLLERCPLRLTRASRTSGLSAPRRRGETAAHA